jgi:anti-anti-sigma factor
MDALEAGGHDLTERAPALDLQVEEPVGSPAAVVRAKGEVDLGSAAALEACLVALIADGRPTAVDLKDVTFIDAAGVGALSHAHRLAQQSGVAFTLRQPARVVARVLRITGVDRVIPVEPATG